MAARWSGGGAAQRVGRLAVPSRVSGSTRPQLSAAISGAMLTLPEMRTGREAARASTTAMPKFSWCEGRMKASQRSNAPVLGMPLRFWAPGDWNRPCHDEVEVVIHKQGVSQSLDEEVAAFLGVDAAEEK